jgi:hypothetical protein
MPDVTIHRARKVSAISVSTMSTQPGIRLVKSLRFNQF